MNTKIEQLKLWALQSGYASITDLAAAAGCSRTAIYGMIEGTKKAGHGRGGDPLLLKLSTLLNIEVATLKEWRDTANEKENKRITIY